MLDRVLRFVITGLGVIAGLLTMAEWINQVLAVLVSAEVLRMGLFGSTLATILSLLAGAFVGGLLGFLLSPLFVRYLWRINDWVEARLNKMPLNDVLAGAVGLSIGLILSNLISSSFLPIPIIGKYIPIVLSIFLGYLGMNIAVRKRDELGFLVSYLPWLNKGEKAPKQQVPQADVCAPKILDTSVIIDGRIADICQSGFVEGRLLVPIFVLEELQHIADSSDPLKRNRGRRGLDILNRMQKELGLAVQIDNRNYEEIAEVDSRLIQLAKETSGKILTNDFNLNKVAVLHGVAVLNINELANAVKPVVLPGEEMHVHLVKDGKEFGQGVAYLDDGTMIVVDGGKKYVGEHIEVLVTSVLQTAAGRMIFAKLKNGERGA